MATPFAEPDRPAALRLAVGADFAAARGAAATVRTFLAEEGIAESELFGCELCVAEACNNAVEYANSAARTRPIAVEATCTPRQIEIRVIDHTTGFNWPAHFTSPPVRAERGRGLFIIHSMMDEVLYLQGAKENVLIMRKKRRRPPAKRAVQSQPLTLDESRHQLAECKRSVSAMARELCFRSETLSAVFRCCAELGRADASKGFEERLLADLLHLISGDWYVLRLLSAELRQLVVASASAPDLATPVLALGSSDRKGRGVEARVASSRKSARFDARKSDPGEPLRAVGPRANGVVYPLCLGDALVGTLAVGWRDGDVVLDDLHEEVGRAFAEFFAIQISVLRRREEDLRAKLFTQELEIARTIQRSLLPVNLPHLPGFGLAGGWHSAQEVGGDFYDAIALSEDVALLIVADVMGKGVPAALFATNLRGLLRGLSARYDDPAQLLGRLNRLLFAELSAVRMFITAQVAVVDVNARKVTVAGAGHCPFLYVMADRGTVEALATQGLPLGVLPGTEYRSQTVTLGRPGALLLHTDGVTDMRNPAGEAFGQHRLAEWLDTNRGRGRSATELRGRLASELNRFRGDAAMTDDQAFLLLSEECTERSPTFEPQWPAEREQCDMLVAAEP